MSEAASTDKSRPTAPWAWLRNPVTVKELRSRMRGRRAFAVLTLYLLILSAVITLVYLVYTSSTSGVDGTGARTAGKGLFAAVLAVQVFLVVFIGPAFTAGAISGEHERQTFDLLRTTLLPAESLVTGKLISALSYVFLLVLVSIPLQSIAFLLGGLSLVELVLSQILILIAAVAYALFGLWCSATMRSTLTATVATFAGMAFVTFGIPLLVGSMLIVLGPLYSSAGLSGPVSDNALVYGGLTVAATNLPATLIISELILLEQGSVFGFNLAAPASGPWFPAPWLLFILIHAAAAVLLYWATVRRVRRVSEV